MLGRMYLKRAAGYAWTSKFDEAIKDFQKALEFKNLYTAQELDSMRADIERVKVRQKSQELKS